MQELINDLLTYSRVGRRPLLLEAVDTNEMVDQVASDLAAAIAGQLIQEESAAKRSVHASQLASPEALSKERPHSRATYQRCSPVGSQHSSGGSPRSAGRRKALTISVTQGKIAADATASTDGERRPGEFGRPAGNLRSRCAGGEIDELTHHG